MQAPPKFTHEVAHALSHLYDPDVLRQHTLLNLLGIHKQSNAQSILREKLIQAIEELKPASDVPIESRAWRVYKVLHLRYIQQLSQEQTAFQIGVGVRHLRREQSAAVTALADTIFQKVNPDQTYPFSGGASERVSAEDELAWLQNNTLEETSNVNNILRVVVQLVAPLAAKRDIRLKLDLTEDLPPAIILPAALRQALISLTTLAINRLASGKITFATSVRQQQVALNIKAESEQSLLPDTPATMESLRTMQLILGELSPRLKTREEAKSSTYQLHLPAMGMVNVLMIDDNKDVADLFKRYTYGTEFSIEYLSSPEQVFEVVERLQPHIILLDIMIPRIDGWELLGRLRQHPLTHTRPIIICSVLPERELALALGANGYLSKPVTRSGLLEMLYHTVALDG